MRVATCPVRHQARGSGSGVAQGSHRRPKGPGFSYDAYRPGTAARAERLRLPRALHHVRAGLRHGPVDARSSRCTRSASRRWPSTWSAEASAYASSISRCSCSTSPTSTSRPTSRSSIRWRSGSTCTGCRTPTARSRSRESSRSSTRDTPVIFGGLSASYFHEELITYDAVDYVVRGDSTEEPMTRLMDALKGGGGIADIPNVTWKDAERRRRRQRAVLGSRRHELHLARLLVQHEVGHPLPRHDGRRAVQGLAAVPGVRLADVPGMHAQLRDLRGSATAFREQFGRDRVAFRDPDLLVRDIQNIQRYIPGPMFVLNDFLQAGPEYTRKFVEGLHSINVKNPIGFEFFRPAERGVLRAARRTTSTTTRSRSRSRPTTTACVPPSARTCTR